MKCLALALCLLAVPIAAHAHADHDDTTFEWSVDIKCTGDWSVSYDLRHTGETLIDGPVELACHGGAAATHIVSEVVTDAVARGSSEIDELTCETVAPDNDTPLQKLELKCKAHGADKHAGGELRFKMEKRYRGKGKGKGKGKNHCPPTEET